MKYIIGYKIFESIDPWGDIISSYDVGQLIELIKFKYGNVIPESSKEFDEYEGDYNPDDIYDSIEIELAESGKMDDFLQNYQSYAIEKDESDPFHWRYRQKEMEKFNKSFRDKMSESVSNSIIDDILLDLTDEGFKFDINWDMCGRSAVSCTHPDITVTITKNDRFCYPDIKETIDRLSGYMESEGYVTDQRFVATMRAPKINIKYKFSSLNLLKAKSKYKI